MKRNKFLVILFLVFGLLFCSACAVANENANNNAGIFDSNDSGYKIYFAVYTKYDVGEVEKKGETQIVTVGRQTTLRAMDTDEYAFSHWEFRGEIISTDREYVLKPTKNDIHFRRYYAVFTPKAENKALVNVLCDNGKTVEEQHIIWDDLKVSGGGYYTIGETATMEVDKDDLWLARSFSYDDVTVDGPVLQLTVEKNINVTATIEKMVEITTAQNDVRTLTLQKEDRFLPAEEEYQVTVTLQDDSYVPDVWLIKDAVTGEVLSEWEWEWNMTLNEVVLYRDVALHKRLLIDLVCTNENLVNTLPVNVVSTTGDKVHIDVEKPEKMISGRAFPLWVKPDENTYIQDIYLTAEATEDFPFPSTIDFCGVEKIYKEGGVVCVSDPRPDFGEACAVEMRAIPRDKAAIVQIFSDDDYIAEECRETGNHPSGYYSPSISTQFLVVEKNKDRVFQLEHYENLYAIYEVGYQFAAIEDETGEKVADNLQFLFNVDKDTNYYVKWEKKPVFDFYFDYTLTEDGTGYVAEISQLAISLGSPNEYWKDELCLPASYNGKPVKEIAPYGFSQYRCYPTKQDLDYYTTFFFERIVLPDSIEKIGEKAFAGCIELEVALPQEDSLSYISPDAFWSLNDAISVNLSERHVQMLLQTLHERYIGKNENFTYKVEPDEHFNNENDQAHYETMMEYVCIKQSAFHGDISAFELGVLYHEFFHHYQIVARLGVGEENLETLAVQPTAEEIAAWNQPYDTEDYEAYWNHPMEVSAREFATLWSGLVLKYAPAP